MKLFRRLVHALGWRTRLFLRPIFKPFQQLLESPVAEKIVYAITEWRFDFLLQKHRVKANAGPEVSIIIPIYNVASYLSVCVKSALLQTHNNVRIVLVEDGSSDNSPEIAKSFADHYENVQLITQKNAGLAAARNTGVEAIKKTDYLLFLDSDDVIPLKAVENYLNAIGSLNLAVGKPTRLKGFALYKRSREIFNKPVVETTLTSRVDFLSDVTAWNKLIRFDFWKAAGYRFPVGFLYEDMALMTRIYAESGGFAAVTKTSYFWRSRVVGGTSITQERWQMTNLEHRLKAIEDTLVVLEELYPRSAKSKDLWDYYQWSTARFDINFFMPWVEHTEQVYFDTLHKTAKRLYADADSLFWKKVPERYRAALKALIAQDRQAVISAIVQARLNVAKPSK